MRRARLILVTIFVTLVLGACSSTASTRSVQVATSGLSVSPQTYSGGYTFYDGGYFLRYINLSASWLTVTDLDCVVDGTKDEPIIDVSEQVHVRLPPWSATPVERSFSTLPLSLNQPLNHSTDRPSRIVCRAQRVVG